MAKDGADGVYAAAMPDGRTVALKIADGANRARPPVMLAALRALGRRRFRGRAIGRPVGARPWPARGRGASHRAVRYGDERRSRSSPSTNRATARRFRSHHWSAG